MTDYLDTGSNPPRGRQYLKTAAEIMLHSGAKMIRPIEDYYGRYGYEMVIGGQAFTLVARGSPWVHKRQINIVSSQLSVLVISNMAPMPLIMACFMAWVEPPPLKQELMRGHLTPRDQQVIAWKLFVPEEIKEKQLGTNMRGSVTMVNWDWDLGRLMDDPGNIPLFWKLEHDRWEKEKATQPVATKLGRFFNDFSHNTFSGGPP